MTYPDGIKDRSAAIQQKTGRSGADTQNRKQPSTGNPHQRVGNARGHGTHRKEEGRLDEWCADNLKYFADTFGKENIVAAHLHRDEQTPHIHITLVPIVKGERKRRKREEQTKKRYRKKPTDTVRLCADDIMTRLKVEVLPRHLRRGDGEIRAAKRHRRLEGSPQVHAAVLSVIYEETRRQTSKRKWWICSSQKETAREELRRAKKEIQTEKLKGAATTAAANIAESVGSLFGSNKVRTLERENTALHREVTTHGEAIEALQTRIQTMQTDHSRQMAEVERKHRREIADKEAKHKEEISFLKTVIARAAAWFPYFREMLRIENLCRFVGFSDGQTGNARQGKAVGVCRGTLLGGT